MSGKIIELEGLDKAGKNVQATNIYQHLINNYNLPARMISYPDYTSFFGKMIKNYLNGTYGTSLDSVPTHFIQETFANDRRLKDAQVRDWVEKGGWIVFDRYAYSNAFGVSKFPRSDWEKELEWMEELEFEQTGLIKPDHVFFLKVDPEISYENRNTALKAHQNGKADLHESNLNLLKAVDELYTIIANKKDNWTIIDQMDGDRRIGIDEVFLKIRPVLDKLVRTRD